MTGRFPRVTEYFLLGKALKAHATSGKLRLQIEERFKPYIYPGSFLFFEFNGSKVPFQVAEVEDDVHFVVTLQDLNSKDQADTLSGKECWIPVSEVKSRHLKSPNHLPDRWSDYYLFDRGTRKAYEILRTEEFPQQLMAVIAYNGKEIFVPLSEPLIASIDRKEKMIYMDIPEGLLEL